MPRINALCGRNAHPRVHAMAASSGRVEREVIVENTIATPGKRCGSFGVT